MVCKTKETTPYILAGALLLGTGLTCGYFLHKLITAKKTIHGDTILKYVKQLFLKEGPIEGSWIELQKVPLQKFALKTDVYYGGISRIEEDQLIQYEFIADAYTGSILDLYRI